MDQTGTCPSIVVASEKDQKDKGEGGPQQFL